MNAMSIQALPMANLGYFHITIKLGERLAHEIGSQIDICVTEADDTTVSRNSLTIKKPTDRPLEYISRVIKIPRRQPRKYMFRVTATTTDRTKFMAYSKVFNPLPEKVEVPPERVDAPPEGVEAPPEEVDAPHEAE